MDTCVDPPKVPSWKLELINRRRTRNHNQSKSAGGGGCSNEQQVKPVQWTWSPSTQHFLQQQQQPNAVQTSPPLPPQQQQQQQQRPQSPPSPSPYQQQQPSVAVGTVCSSMRLFQCEATTTAVMANFKKNPQINRCRSKFKTNKPQIISEITNGLDYRSDSSEEFKYGPGIVNKLKSKYMSMTVREQKPRPPLRRSTSMDNIVEDKRSSVDKQPKLYSQPDVVSMAATAVKSETMKRARSMEILSDQTVNGNNGYADDEQPMTTNGELPPPDVVKTYKKIFETKTLTEAKPVKTKPAILPKPMLSPEKTRPTRMNKVPSKKMSPPIKYPNRLKKKEPLGFDRSKSLINDEVSSSQDESSMSSDDGGSARHKVAIKTVILAPAVDNKPIPVVQTKQICVIRPTTRTTLHCEETASNQLSDKEIENNFINNNNTNNTNGEKRIGGLWDKKRWDNHENSVVFNFVNRKGVPNYIDSETPLQRRGNSYGINDGCIQLDAHCEESSTDDIDNVKSDSYVIFVGDNIIIGRSNLRKENSSTSRKDLRIKFSDTLETMHEYPSEASMLVEDESTRHDESTTIMSPKSKFANYIPSKSGTNEEAFLGEYGVSRSNVIKSAKRSADKTEEDQSVIDTNVPWSEETTPDLLF